MPAPGRAAAASASSARNGHGRRPSQSTSDYQQHRRDKTKSSPSYVQRPPRDSSHAAVLQAPIHVQGQAQRPSKSRAHSAPHVPKSHLAGPQEGISTFIADHEDASSEDPSDDEAIADDPFFQRFDISQRDRQHDDMNATGRNEEAAELSDSEGPLSPTSKVMRARPDSTAEPVHSPLNPQSPTSWPENSARLQEINIVVTGSPHVGKSAFIQKAFNLQGPPSTAISSRKMSIDGNVYVVRLIELPNSELDMDTDNRICWPESVLGQAMPYIDGAFTLYDVMNKESLVQVPETLSGIYNASIPFILVACKCDFPSTHRHVDPTVVEKRAKALIGDITAFQTSKAQPDSQKRCVAVLLRAIVSMRNQRIALAAAARRRANSSAVKRVSPQPNSYKHNRANSEFSGSIHRSQHSASHTPASPARLMNKSKSSQALPMLNTSHSGLLKESGHLSDDAERDSSDEETNLMLDKPLPTPMEVGYTFDQLVDKLLAQPMTKNDQKFATVFLALYRKFASPGQLLTAIIDRFDMLRASSLPEMTRMAAQQRQLGIMEQWIGSYPGDFAWPSTKQIMAAFMQRISSERIFAVDAREISADLESVAEDDDTNWDHSDSSRSSKYDSGNGMARSMATLSLLSDSSPNLTLRSPGSIASSSTSRTLMDIVETAERSAKMLTPTSKYPLTKIQWHALMDQPDDAIAKELTRMDSIMFTSIRPRDLVRYVSMKADEKVRCKSLENVHRMIEHFNYLADWVQNFILLRDKPKHRALMLEKFYRIARELRKLNNYNSLAAVVSGVNNSSIYRLQATKDLVSESSAKDFKRLEVLMSPQKSHAAYRLAWENTSGERIPYLPLHKRDLVAAAEGNRTFIGEGPREPPPDEDDPELRINWKKFEYMGEVIVSVQRAQGVPYEPFKANEEIKSLVCETKIQRDEDDLYDRSCHVEPSGGGARRRFNWFAQSGDRHHYTSTGSGGGSLVSPTSPTAWRSSTTTAATTRTTTSARTGGSGSNKSTQTGTSNENGISRKVGEQPPMMQGWFG